MNAPTHMHKLFAPRTIAVVGASSAPGKTGAVPLTLLQKHGYDGAIFAVNPNAEHIQGLPCFASISDIDENIDLVIIAVPAELAYTALQQARPGQVSSAVIFSSGFAETGAIGQQQQQRLQDLAAERQIRLLGPNCLGYINVRAKTYATFSPAPLAGVVQAGRVGMVTQSGAFGAYAYAMAHERGLGLSFWISTGNESDVCIADCINLLVDDPHTSVIMTYMEGCRDKNKLELALARARTANKPIVMTKVGRTAAGARAVASHTAAIAGDDAFYDSLFRQYGVIRAYTIEEFFHIGSALNVWGTRTRGDKLGIISISGGVGALMADEAEVHELSLPEPPDSLKQRLLSRIPFASAHNPVDLTGQAITDPALLIDTTRDMLNSGVYSSLVIFLAAAGSAERMWPHIQELARTTHKYYPHIPIALSTRLPKERCVALEKYGYLTFSDPSIAVRTMAAIFNRSCTS